MRTINVNYSKTYAGTQTTIEQLREVISEGIYEQIILPIFGENNDQISNMKYIETKLIDNTLCFDFDLNNTLAFRITVSVGSFASNQIYTGHYQLIQSDLRDSLSYISRFNNSFGITCERNSVSGYTYYMLRFRFDYMVSDSEMKTIWMFNNLYQSIVFDTVTIDSEDIPVVNVMQFGNNNNATSYRLSSINKCAINNNNKPFNLDGKVMIEKVPFMEGGNIIGLQNSLIGIHNTNILTNNLTATKQLIDIDGVKYRQIAGCYWMEDRD